MSNKILYKTSIIDLILGTIGLLLVCSLVALLVAGGYWWLSIPLVVLIVFVNIKNPLSFTVYDDRISCTYIYKRTTYNYSDIEYIEMSVVGKWNSKALEIRFKNGFKVFIEYDGLGDCINFLNEFKRSNVNIIKGKYWNEKIKTNNDGRFYID